MLKRKFVHTANLVVIFIMFCGYGQNNAYAAVQIFSGSIRDVESSENLVLDINWGESNTFPDNEEWFEKCKALLSNPKIASAIIWIRPNCNLTYSRWNTIQKEQLKTALWQIEKGKPFPMDNPPQLIDDRYISDADAWDIFIINVAHSLWLEANQINTHREHWIIFE